RIDAEVADLIAGVRKDAEAERARIIAAAEAQAEHIRRDAEVQIQAEIARAREELSRKVAQLALAAAEALIKGALSEADHRRILDQFVNQLEALPRAPQSGSGATPRPGSAATPAPGRPS